MIRAVEPGEGALVAAEFWYPLAKRMEPYSALNELADDVLDTAGERFEELLRRDDRYDFFYERDGAPVGYISAEVGERSSRVEGRYLAIVDLYVKEDARRRGVGTHLVEHVEEVADAADCDFVRVAAEWENDAARAFYEDYGYQPKQVKFAKRLE